MPTYEADSIDNVTSTGEAEQQPAEVTYSSDPAEPETKVVAAPKPKAAANRSRAQGK